jgi:hypothetical protein
VTIDSLPDVALLEVFDFYVDEAWKYGWYALVHVCQKWRELVFGFARRLNLRVHCNASTPMRKMLDVWPPLPIVIKENPCEDWGADNIVLALEHNDRICQLELLPAASSQLEKVLAAMRQPFPALTRLQLRSIDEAAPVDPDSFLNGSAPLLDTLVLQRIPFPGLPKLFLSATHLVRVHLSDIPHSGYISPEEMVTGLSTLTSLKSLQIKFNSPQRRPDQKNRLPPPLTHTLLPVLTMLEFKGVSEYLEDFVALIDAPLLDDLEILLFHQPIIDTPQLARFISGLPKFKARHEARVVFSNWDVWITLLPKIHGALKLVILCEELDLQVSSVVQVLSSSFPQAYIPAVECLHIVEDQLDVCQDDVENIRWLELLRPFIAVKDLHMPCEITSFIAPALQELVGERVAEVLPSLQTLFLEEQLLSEPDQEAIRQFVAARQLASHRVAISCWERDGSEDGGEEVEDSEGGGSEEEEDDQDELDD